MGNNIVTPSVFAYKYSCENLDCMLHMKFLLHNRLPSKIQQVCCITITVTLTLVLKKSKVYAGYHTVLLVKLRQASLHCVFWF